MLKETIICIVIIVSILLGNSMLQNYTEESIEELTGNLTGLREKLNKDEIQNQEVKENIENIYHQWEKRHDKLAYYIDHNELEKIETELTGIRSHIETEEYNESISELDKSMFLLKHIQDKYAFNLQNVF